MNSKSLSPLQQCSNFIFKMNPCLVFILVALAGMSQSQTQQADYCKISLQNTMCLYLPYIFATTCPTIVPTTVSATDKQFIVDLHNKLRGRVALGLETGGTPGPQPKASNMRAVTWDDELALMADTHVRQCVYKHDTNRDVARFAVGQNIASRGTWPSNGVLNWTSPIQAWYDEVVDYNAAQVTNFTSGTSATGKTIGHYTQVVWAKTYKVGCSVVNWLDTQGWYKYFYACNYGPAGNYLRQPVYLIGSPASACQTGTVANTATGLCV